MLNKTNEQPPLDFEGTVMNKYIDLKPKDQNKQEHCTVRSNISHNVSFFWVRAKTPLAKPKPVEKLFNIPISINGLYYKRMSEKQETNCT